MKVLVSILFLFFILSGYGQENGASIYGNLSIKKDYNFTISFNPQIALYKVNNQKVDKDTYYQYLKIKKEAADCCPCITKTYDAEEKLLREDVLCGDCNVGYFIVYNGDGTTKVKGQFKENDSGNWENISNRGYCGIPDGKWIFYSKNGAPKYVELWDKGQFIKQIPQQKKVEIWKIEMMLGDSVFDQKSIPVEQIKNLSFQPHFKNQHTSAKLNIKVEINNGKLFATESFSASNFSSINVLKSLSQLPAPKEFNPHIIIQVFHDNRLTFYTRIQVIL